MKASELIAEIQRLAELIGGDPEVLCQTSGCCAHGHEINLAEAGDKVFGSEEEVGKIVLRAG